jgi:filamentous hemagglutinin family protein
MDWRTNLLGYGFMSGLAVVGCVVSAIAQPISPAPDGTGTIVSPNGVQLDISGGTQSQSNLFHSFQQFNLSPNQIANFLSTPNIQNILGRVVGGDPSIIQGLIQVSGSTANLYLMNPAGIVFGSGASLNVPGSFTATTANGIWLGGNAGAPGGWFPAVGSADYAALVGNPAAFAFLTPQPGSIFNAGNLAVGDGQRLALIGGTILNTGTLSAPNGAIAVVAVPGENLVRLSQPGSLLSVEFQPLPPSQTAAALPTPPSLPALLTGGNLTGATGAIVENGIIRLTSTNTAIPTSPGTAIVSGTVSVSPPTSRVETFQQNVSTAEIAILGDKIALLSANVDASSPAGGGTIRIGGGYQGQGAVPNAQFVTLDPSSTIRADGFKTGQTSPASAANGGQIIVWADQTTRVYGTVSAQASSQGGNGGLIETSGRRSLDVSGARVNAGAANGVAGTWLLDPGNITLSNAPTTVGTLPLFAPGAIDSNINIADLVATLDSGTNVTITTAGADPGFGDLTLVNPINQTNTLSTASLTLTGRRFTALGDSTISLASSGGLVFNLNQVNPEALASTDSIQTAIDAIGMVNGNSTINLGTGTYSGATVFVNKNLTLNGTGEGATVLDGANTRRVVDIQTGTTATLQNLTIANGQTPATESGAGVYNAGALTLNQTRLTGNQAGLEGGAIYADTTATTIINGGTLTGNTAGLAGGGIRNFGTFSVDTTAFTGNSAQFGGAISNMPSGTAAVTNATFTTNIAQINGGAIANDGQISVSQSNFVSNQAISGVGGAIGNTNALAIVDSSFTNNSTPFGTANAGGSIASFIGANPAPQVQVSNSKFDNNSSYSGGAISNPASITLTVQGASFSGNVGDFEGSAILNRGTLSLDSSIVELNTSSTAIESYGTSTISNSQIRNNTADFNGGGVDNRGTMTISSSLITGNVSPSGGGGVYNTGTLTIISSDITNNRANVSGGGILNDRGTLTITSSTISGNTAVNTDGGGIAAGGATTITNSRILNNRARDGGGVHLFAPGGGSLTIADSIIEGNVASNVGGGIEADTGDFLSLRNLTIANNQSARFGGGVAISQSTPIATIDNATITGNQSGDTGGGINSDRTVQLILSNSTLSNNSTSKDGGGLANFGSATITSTIFSDNSATQSGGAISNLGSLTLNSSTLDRNTADIGGGLRNFSFGGETGRAIVTNSRITNNTANGGVGIHNTANLTVDITTIDGNSGSSPVYSDGQATITNSTIANNRDTGNGGGLDNRGTMDITNITISGNSTPGNGGGILNQGNLRVSSSTITNNSAGNQGGGIASIGTTQIRNSIVSGNFDPSSPDVSGFFIDQGNNLIGIAEGSTGFGASELVGSRSRAIAAGLAPLSNNGGATQTHALLPDSPALGRGGNASAVDQRGVRRGDGSGVDIGAFESGLFRLVAPPPVESPQLPPPEATEAIQQSQTVPLQVSAVPGAILDTSAVYGSPGALVASLESSFSSSYEAYYGLPKSEAVDLQAVQNTLQKVQRQRQIRAAVIYAFFAPQGTVVNDDSARDRIISGQAKDTDTLQLLLITPNGKPVHRSLQVRRSQVLAQAKLFRIAVADPDDERSYIPLSKQFYEWLLKALESDLQKENITHLVYCLDEGIRTLPLAALLDPQGFIVERYTVSLIPSASLVDLDNTASLERTVLPMGADRFLDLPPLPAVPTELALVNRPLQGDQVWLNEAFTLDNLKGVKERYRPGILHLATHAQFNSGAPDRSFIQLWDSKLTLAQVRSLNWQKGGLGLLTLSACTTAVGNRESELGFAGLVSAAGVRSTLGSLWAVSDVGTLALMSEFYSQLRTSPSTAEALRRAQLRLLKGKTQIQQGSLINSEGQQKLAIANLSQTGSFQHPFFWSAFTLVGNPW